MSARLYRLKTLIDGNVVEDVATNDRDVLLMIEQFNNMPECTSIFVEYMDSNFNFKPLLRTSKKIGGTLNMPIYHISTDNVESTSNIVITDKENVELAIAAFMTDPSIIRMVIDKEEGGNCSRIFTAERSYRNDRNDSCEKK